MMGEQLAGLLYFGFVLFAWSGRKEYRGLVSMKIPTHFADGDEYHISDSTAKLYLSSSECTTFLDNSKPLQRHRPFIPSQRHESFLGNEWTTMC